MYGTPDEEVFAKPRCDWYVGQRNGSTYCTQDAIGYITQVNLKFCAKHLGKFVVNNSQYVDSVFEDSYGKRIIGVE